MKAIIPMKLNFNTYKLPIQTYKHKYMYTHTYTHTHIHIYIYIYDISSLRVNDLMQSSSILLLILGTSFRAKDLRLCTVFRSSLEHVCSSDECYSFTHVLFMFIGGEFSSYIHVALMFILLNYLTINTFYFYI